MNEDGSTVEAVLTELDWDSRIDASRIRVLAFDGVVFLRGKVRSFAEKWAASRAALRAYGVLDVHNELEISLRLRDRLTDEELRLAALRALQREPLAPNGVIAVDVSAGRVTLRGVVDEPLEIDASEAAIRRLAGVVGLRNELSLRGRSTLAPRSSPGLWLRAQPQEIGVRADAACCALIDDRPINGKHEGGRP